MCIRDRVTAEQLLDLPRPVPFKSSVKQVQSSAAAYWRVETLLELCHHAPSQQNVRLDAVEQLVDIADFDQFCTVYADFNVVDLWLYLEDVTMLDKIGKQGLQALGPQLERGVPLGMYRVPDLLTKTRSDHEMILCKVALGRTLPMAAGAQLDSRIELPTGYHSLYIPADMDPLSDDGAQLCDDATPAFFADNYLVKNINLVLPTHKINFSYHDPASTHQLPGEEPSKLAAAGQCVQCQVNMASFFDLTSNRPVCERCALQFQEAGSLVPLDKMPAIVDCCQSCGTGMPLDRFCRLCGVAVCMDCKLSGRHQGKEHVFLSVEDSYQAMLSEVAELATTIPPVVSRLEEYEHTLENFMLDSMCQVDNFKQDLISYVSHHQQVGQALQLRRFDVDRIVSDFDRLLEFHYYEQQMCPKVQFVAQWEHMQAMCESIKQRISHLEQRPGFNRFTMALTQKNQAIVGARRQVLFRENVIERLADRLQERGCLTPEDEELIATLHSQPQTSNLHLPTTEAERKVAIKQTRALLNEQ
eukprot:TRINITY_DN15257_c0_g1_i2.p1 TRINITY_DN15257_c0_g1~~TRINITY_DN15257_c0_g1_i2.p1  ORF type:complete len:529 (-),score=112.94 TRINITY_DN15257_c0_g1_i2:213-1799(-)